MAEQDKGQIVVNLRDQATPEGGFDPWQRYVKPSTTRFEAVAILLTGLTVGRVIVLWFLLVNAAWYWWAGFFLLAVTIALVGTKPLCPLLAIALLTSIVLGVL